MGTPERRDLLMKKLKSIGAINIQNPIDFAQGLAIVRFTFEGKNYNFQFKDRTASEAYQKLASSIRMLVIAHERGILLLGKTAKEFLMIDAPKDFVNSQEFPDVAFEDWRELDLTPISTNEQIKSQYMRLIRTYHPDRVMFDQDKKHHEEKTAKINQAYSNIKKSRGFE